MIKRISKNNDLKDIIKGYPDGVLDNIYDIKYYTYGHEDNAVHPDFEVKEDIIVVILPSSDLQTIPNGLLYRKAYYEEYDESYPDGKYNLELCDNMNTWLGEETSEGGGGGAVTPEWVDAEIDLKLEPYATTEYVDEEIERVESEIPSLEGYATQSWVSSQGYLTEHQDISGKADVSYVDSEISRVESEIPSLTGYATTSYVDSEISDVRSEIPSLEGYATESWVEGKGYLTEHQDISGKADVSYVDSEISRVEGLIPSVSGLASVSYVDSEISDVRSEIPSLDGYATESWVEGKGYLTEHQDISGKANISYVDSEIGRVEGLIPSVSGLASVSYVDSEISEVKSEIPSLDGYATQSWVEGKGYLTEHQTLKTINQQSIVGSGDIEISGGGVGQSEGTGKGEIFNVYEGSYKNIASGLNSHAEGYKTKAEGWADHTEGYWTEANGTSNDTYYPAAGAHAEGKGCVAKKGGAHAEGDHTKALGRAFHSEGYFCETYNTDRTGFFSQVGFHAEGSYNVYNNSTFQHTVGIGTSSSARKNAHTITTDGKHYIPNVGGYQGTETDVTNVQDVATVINNKMTGTIWSGTQAQWDALTPTQQASYTIALITE